MGLASRALGLLVLCLPLLAACGTPAGAWVRSGPGPLQYDLPPALATLADGRVLAAGGLAFGASTNQAFVYRPAASRWTVADAMPVPAAGFAAASLPGGGLLVAGGESSLGLNPAYLSTAQVYVPGGGWQAPLRMPAALGDISALSLRDGRVLLLGGFGAGGPARIAWIFDPGSRGFQVLRPPPAARVVPAMVQLRDGRVLVVGGDVAPGAFSSPQPVTAALLDIASSSWGPAPSPGGSGPAALTLLPDGSALSVQAARSGPGGAIANVCADWAPGASSWHPVACPPVPVDPAAFFRIRGTPELLGWSPNDGSTRVAAYASGSWIEGPPLMAAPGTPVGTPLPGGRLLIVQQQSYAVFDPQAQVSPGVGGGFAAPAVTYAEAGLAALLLVLFGVRLRRGRHEAGAALSS